VCGIALILGDDADPTLLHRMLAALASRGELTETQIDTGLVAGTRRLPIVDRDHAIQPWLSADGQWLLCYNGEIFNHRDNRADLVARGRPMRSVSDTEVVLEAFLAWGESAVERLRGEYAFAIVHRSTRRTYLARDPLGVKPLYWSRRDGRLHVASEVKALVPIGAPIGEIPPGHHGWADPETDPATTPHVDLQRLGDDQIPLNDPDEAAKLVRMVLRDSIRVRVDTDLPVGVILSGGLDSSLTLMHVQEFHPDCIAFTIGAPGSEDLTYARRLAADLGVPHEVIELQPRDVRLADIREAIRVSELSEYGDIINAVVSLPLFRRVRECGVKVVLTGDGSDELFGGYPMYHHSDGAAARRLFQHKIRNLGRTELQRVDRASMAYGVEARVPFLDPAVVELAMRLPLDLKLRDGVEKWIVRQAFADVLPDSIRARPKNPMSHSSGLHERARLYKPLFARVHRSYGYDLREPVRRDFSTVLAQSGHDLERAVATESARTDYTAFEHARDMAGAIRWNAVRPRAQRAPAVR
jgi:asparagine synthase (glutamine-hydrolysing)